MKVKDIMGLVLIGENIKIIEIGTNNTVVEFDPYLFGTYETVKDRIVSNIETIVNGAGTSTLLIRIEKEQKVILL